MNGMEGSKKIPINLKLAKIIKIKITSNLKIQKFKNNKKKWKTHDCRGSRAVVAIVRSIWPNFQF